MCSLLKDFSSLSLYISKRKVKILILDSALCAVWLCGVIHTAEIDLVVGCILQSFLKNWLRGVLHTVEIDSAVWCTLHTVRLTRWCDGYPGDYWDFVCSWLRGVMHTEEIDCSMMHTTESDLAVWCRSWRLSPWYDTHHGDWLSSGMHTAEHFKH